MKRLVLLFVAFILIVSCDSSDGVRKALRLAGENRRELEKVLAHYSKDKADSLKLRAAEYLIANMPGHYTLESPAMARIRANLDNDTARSYFSKKHIDIYSPFFISNTGVVRKDDITNITADFLIEHINIAFEQLEQYSWLDNFPFDMFLEYLLPYRFANERLDFWRDSLRLDSATINEISYCDNLKYLPSRISYYFPPNRSIRDKPFLDLTFGKTDASDDCISSSLKELIECRAVGVPAAVDFIPSYGNRNGYHYWITYMTPEYKIPETRYAIERKAPKVYRFMYTRQNQYKGKNGEYIPELFRNEFIGDVTDFYVSSKDVSIRNLHNLDLSVNYAYLCVFNNLKWLPVAIGNYSHKSVSFKQVGDNIVYLPVAYNQNSERMVILNYPFILYHNGKIEHLIPDTTSRYKLFLTHKYPKTLHVNTQMTSVSGSYWTASNDPGFTNIDTIFTYRISDNIIEVVKHDSVTPSWRYWKFTSSEVPLTFAEFMFFDENGQRIHVPLGGSLAALFDGDPLTNATPDSDSFIVDMGYEAKISKIICMPSSDGNGIIPDNRYELFYCDLNGWQSLGDKIAEDCWLEYDNVPANALLWLRNHTAGIEERIFTAKNGSVRFW